MIYAQYYFWLVAVSLFVFVAERLFTWRKDQKILRNGIGQDLFWLIFNGHYLGLILAMVTGYAVQGVNSAFFKAGLPVPESLALMRDTPLWLQAIVFFLLKDFIEWNIHRLLHRTPWLWEFHKLHHSIEDLDWIGNFRFHWGEVIVYKALSYLPLVVLGIDWHVMLAIAVFGTLAQDLNHANIRTSWGPFRFLFNSPMMHVWHHDVELHGKGGQNFGIVLSLWDWLFGTVYWPGDVDQPEKLGFEGIQRYPRGLVLRFAYPFYKIFPRHNLHRLWLCLLFVPFLFLSGGCSGKAEPKLEQWINGGYQTTPVSAYEITGKRDGAATRALVTFTLKSGGRLRMELEVVYNPNPSLGSGFWIFDGNPRGSGEVVAESLKFLGGQGEGPSLGGRFRLDENENPRFRVVLPLSPIGQSGWSAD